MDPAKDAINRQKHGIALSVAMTVLTGAHLLQRSAVRNASNEDRWVAIARVGDDFLACIYTMRGTLYRMISIRAARTREKEQYEQAFRQE